MQGPVDGFRRGEKRGLSQEALDETENGPEEGFHGFREGCARNLEGCTSHLCHIRSYSVAGRSPMSLRLTKE